MALSADGNTALIGGPSDNGGVGAAWVFTRSGSTWTQQGAKLTGSGESGNGDFGASVALSADGNTALIGGPGDNGSVGAAWVFTRSGSTWTQQGAKLTGSGESGEGYFGASVALSADGNTALIGGASDNDGVGAAWVFTRSGSTWTQQGAKLTGSGEIGEGHFGVSVALSADGNTALIGGPSDNGGVGAAWVFTRSGSTWTQQGAKLTGSGEIGDGRLRLQRGAVGRRQHRPDRRRRATTATSARRGCSRARARPGPSRAQSSPAAARAETATSATAWRCRPTATPP